MSEVIFQEDLHQYTSITPEDKQPWLPVTRFVESFGNPFDPIEMSKKCSMNPNSKWFAMDPEEIQRIWSGENRRSTVSGTSHHKMKEDNLLNQEFILQGEKKFL